MVNLIKIIAVPAFIMLVTACAIEPRIHSLYDPEADFGRFATYNFAPEAKAGSEQYTSLLTKNLIYAISQEMETRGYRLADKPDLLVNFNIKTREKIDVHEMPVTRPSPFYTPYPYPYYYSYRFGFYNPWPYYAYETRVIQYTEGTLNIDVIDAPAKQLVWEGAAIGRVREDKENMPEYVRKVIASVFEKYPFVAGKSDPVAPAKE